MSGPLWADRRRLKPRGHFAHTTACERWVLRAGLLESNPPATSGSGLTIEIRSGIRNPYRRWPIRHPEEPVRRRLWAKCHACSSLQVCCSAYFSSLPPVWLSLSALPTRLIASIFHRALGELFPEKMIHEKPLFDLVRIAGPLVDVCPGFLSPVGCTDEAAPLP